MLSIKPKIPFVDGSWPHSSFSKFNVAMCPSSPYKPRYLYLRRIGQTGGDDPEQTSCC